LAKAFSVEREARGWRGFNHEVRQPGDADSRQSGHGIIACVSRLDAKTCCEQENMEESVHTVYIPQANLDHSIRVLMWVSRLFGDSGILVNAQ
jgi:hypothetical protein